MIHTRTRHHEELQILPQIAGYCYVAITLGLGAAVAVIKGNNQQPKDEDHEND